MKLGEIETDKHTGQQEHIKPTKGRWEHLHTEFCYLGKSTHKAEPG